MAKSRNQTEFGDFQTPDDLASEVCQLVARMIQPRAILEPTCGLGSLLSAALAQFPDAKGLGLEINPHYAEGARQRMAQSGFDVRSTIRCANFFETDWEQTLRDLPGPVLLIGNPPWVTNSTLGGLGATNLPAKKNLQGLRGLDAKTGKSNFDISEWMLIRLLEVSRHLPNTTLAMLCKTSVARKVLSSAWSAGIAIRTAEIHPIDAMQHFGAAVDACVLTCTIESEPSCKECTVYKQLGRPETTSVIGVRANQLVANVAAYDRFAHLQGDSPYTWRSGVKHDCSQVMELRRDAGGLRNGRDERVVLEESHLFPMLKSSDIASGKTSPIRRWMLVTQRTIGEDTSAIAFDSPSTWTYLQSNSDALSARASSIYRGRPAFSIFGVGPYTFSPWKVAISGLYKKLEFTTVGPFEKKPVIFDDTVNFLPCDHEAEARLICELLTSAPAQEFLAASVFWDSKRPITVGLLSRLNLVALASHLSRESELREVSATVRRQSRQPLLL